MLLIVRYYFEYMAKQPSVAKIFGYDPDGISLRGFPLDNVLGDIGNSLANEKLLRCYRRQDFNGRWMVFPIFDPAHIKKRQDFFKRANANNIIRKRIFDSGLPEVRNLRDYRSYEDFFDLCGPVYDAIEEARDGLRPYRHLPEARAVLNRLKKFDGKLESLLGTLRAIDEGSGLAIDTETGQAAFISGFPNERAFLRGSGKKRRNDVFDRRLIYEIKLKAKKQVVKLAKEAGVEFQRGVLQFVKDEFRFSPGSDNLRAFYEQIALPLRLYAKYSNYLEVCSRYSVDDVCQYIEEDYETDVDPRVFLKLVDNLGDTPLVPKPVYPSFSDHYDVQGLFPLVLMNNYEVNGSFIPIDFKTEPGEKKLLLAGLHSGCKSFYMRNLVLLSIFGQAGVDIPGRRLVLPKYNRIIYYRNDRESHGGSCESEMSDLNYIIRGSQEDDLIVIDDFFDKAEPEIATALSPRFLDRLLGTESTVIMASHRSSDYEDLARKGWILMTPDYTEINGEIVPLKRLKRGPPDRGVNLRYSEQKCDEICG